MILESQARGIHQVLGSKKMTNDRFQNSKKIQLFLQRYRLKFLRKGSVIAGATLKLGNNKIEKQAAYDCAGRAEYRDEAWQQQVFQL